jgi:hypothetical protein
MTLRTPTVIVSLLDAAVCALIALAMFNSEADPATQGLDEAAGCIVTVLLLITAGPAFALVLFRRAPKTALILALAFPAAFTALFVAAIIAFA